MMSSICPQNPLNTFPLGALKVYSCFKLTIADTHVGNDMVIDKLKSYHLSVRTFNVLHFINLQIVTFVSPQATVPLINTISSFFNLHQLSDIHPKNVKYNFSKEVMALTVPFYAYQHDPRSPSIQAIQDINRLLHSKFAALIIAKYYFSSSYNS